MKIFALLIALVVSTFASLSVDAKTIRYEVVHTTQYRTDGGALTTIPANGVRDAVVTYAVCVAGQPGTVNRGTLNIVPPATSASTPDVPAGQYCATAVTRLNAAAFPGATLTDSVASNVAVITVTPPVVQPEPPSLLAQLIALIKRLFGHFA